MRTLILLALVPGIVACGGGAAQRTTTETTGQSAPPTAVAQPKAAVTSPAAPVASPQVAAPKVAPATVAPSPTARQTVQLEVGAYKVQDTQFGVRLVGYIENKGSVPAASIQLAASLIDEGGKTVAAQNAIYMRDLLPPGERSPFLAQFSQRPPPWQTEKLQAQAQPYDARSFTATSMAQGLTAEDVTLVPPANPSAGYKVTGQIKNGGSTTVTSAAALVILYDSDKKPLDVTQTYSQLQQVAAGDTAPFSADFPFTKAGVESHEVWVQGRIQR